MACYISAGHHKKDPGAVANGLKEADLTVRVRDEVVKLIKAKGYKVITDDDNETLAEYLKRIQPGDGSVVVEFHFDAAANPDATGTSAFFADGGDIQHLRSRQFAADLCAVGAFTMGIRNRGAQSETQSHRGRLGLVHEPGINCLIEVCFITNPYDLQKFNQNFTKLCEEYAKVIMHYDDLVK